MNRQSFMYKYALRTWLKRLQHARMQGCIYIYLQAYVMSTKDIYNLKVDSYVLFGGDF